MAHAHKPRRSSKAARRTTHRQTSRALHAARKRPGAGKRDATKATTPASRAEEARRNAGPKNIKKPVTTVPAAVKEGLKPLVALGRKKGYLTYDEVNSFLPEEVTSGDQIDRKSTRLNSSHHS